MQKPRHTLLFRMACDGLKLLALLLAGFICACLFLLPFGAGPQATVLVETVMPFFAKLTVSLLSLLAIAVIFESLE
mgnify:CR=1 FL=1